MDKNYCKRRYTAKKYLTSSKDISENTNSDRLINQCLISILFLLGVLVLHFAAPNSNIIRNFKCQLNRNLPLENVKSFVVQNFYTAREILLNDPKDNQKLLKQLQKKDSTCIKKNPNAKTANPKI